jgi:uncharacterized membrane protein
VAGAVVLAGVTVTIDHRSGSVPGWLGFTGGPTSALQVLATVAASMMTFTGLVFTITVVVLQLASSQFSPRVLRTFLRDLGSQVPLGVFTATFVYALIVLFQVRTGTTGPVFVPRLAITVSFALVLSSLVAFVYLVNHVAQSIRVVNIIEAVAAETRRSIDALHPDPYDDDAEAAPDMSWPAPAQVIVVEVHGGGADLHRREVLRQVDIARERTLRQDPAYGLRQLADIAEKALSPALNDPTTAVQAIDRLHDVLARLGRRRLESGVYRDDDGRVRLVREADTWPGYVALAFEEIREYGGSSVQVHRRLRAAVLELLTVVPPSRRRPLERQLRLLDLSAASHFPASEERALAAASDESGMGNVREPRGPGPAAR